MNFDKMTAEMKEGYLIQATGMHANKYILIRQAFVICISGQRSAVSGQRTHALRYINCSISAIEEESRDRVVDLESQAFLDASHSKQLDVSVHFLNILQPLAKVRKHLNVVKHANTLVHVHNVFCFT